MDLHPKNASGVLTDAMNYLGRTWRPLAGIGLATFLPAGVLTFMVFQALGSRDLLELLLDPVALSALPPEAAGEIMGPFMQGLGITTVIQIVATLFVLTAGHFIVASEVGERRFGVTEAASRAARRLPSVLIAAAITGIPVVFALFIGWGVANPFVSLVFVASGVWLLASVSMAVPVLTIESTGVVDAITKSFQLVKGRRLPTIGFLAAIGLLGLFAMMLIQFAAIPMVALGDASFELSAIAALGVVFQGVVAGTLGAPLTAWYLDLRARSEPLTTGDLV